MERHCADLLLAEQEEVVRSWIEHVCAEPGAASRQPLPLRELVPEVLPQVAEFLCSDEVQLLTTDAVVTERLAAVGRDRFRQRVHPRQLIHDFELLARVLDGACLRWVQEYPDRPAPAAVIRVAGRLNRAPILLAELAVGAYHDEQARIHGGDGERIRAFANNLAHELKTPLGAAETAALALEDDGVVTTSQDRRRFAGIIQRSLRRARTTLDDLRALALAESAESTPRRRLPLGLVLGSVLTGIREVVDGAGVEIEVVEPVPDVVVDAVRVQLILLNLLDNAAKYADPLRSLPRVRIAFEPDAEDGVWWVAVSDNGLGIAEEHRPRVFDRFFRAHPERAEGSGLGLAIVREAAEQMGSSLQLESEPGVGSTFRFSLRLA